VSLSEGSLKAFVKNATRAAVPLLLRKRIAVWVHKQEWIEHSRRTWWATELIRDFVQRDPNAYHKFLWSHHLAYAAPYEVKARFGADSIRASRQIFFSHLCKQLTEMGVDRLEVRSVYEVGCSLGYQLRYMETDLFPSAKTLEGVDIDQYAIHSGMEYLRSVRSNVSLKCGDMQQLNDSLGNRHYDIIVCTGVLMYLTESEATEVVRGMLSHCRVLLAIAGLAHPTLDNALFDCSEVRSNDHTFIHNIDRMVQVAGGKVVGRRWDGSRLVDGQTIYFVFAAQQETHKNET